MTVCLKCGAVNPPDGKLCSRCEMPLPNSGAGRTLPGTPTDPPARQTAPTPADETRLPPAEPPDNSKGGGEFAVVAPRSRRHDQTLFGAQDAPAASGGARADATLPRQQHAQTLVGVAPGASGSPGTPRKGKPALDQTLIGVSPLARSAGNATPKPSGTAGTLGQTLIGVAPTAPGAGSPQSPPKLDGTLIGWAPAAADDLASPAATPQGTLMGLSSGNATPALAAPPSAAPESAPGAESAERAVGRGPEGPPPESSAGEAASRHESAPGTFDDGADAGQPPAPVAKAPLHANTALGVAIPGIAPLRPGVASGGPPPAVSARAAQEAAGALDATELGRPSVRSPATLTQTLMRRTRLPKGALVLIGSGLVLGAAALAFAFLWHARSSISARVGADASGRERIDLVCEDCPDGTTIQLGEASTEVSGMKAYLQPSQPLPLGPNQIELRVTRPGESEALETVALPPIEYRIQLDPAGLEADEPQLSLDVRALPGSRVTIAGREVVLDSGGTGRVSFPLKDRLQGPANEIESFAHPVEYAIETPGGRRYDGQLETKVSVAPLMLEAPGAVSVTDLERFMLAGRALKGSRVEVAGSALEVDAQGRFAQLMSIDSVGETRVTVRASHAGLAPRFVTFRLERVASLREKASKLSAKPLESVLGSLSGRTGEVVELRGAVQEIKRDGHRTLLLVRHSKSCESGLCLARVVYGGLRKLVRGQNVRAIGKLTGSVKATPEGDEVPEIEATLLL